METAEPREVYFGTVLEPLEVLTESDEELMADCERESEKLVRELGLVRD